MDDELRAAGHAAFHVGPLQGLTLLAARPDDLTEDDRHAQWLRGVCLGALGTYGEAFDVLGAIAAPRTGGPDHWASLASSALGSLHRQLGRHEPAREHDLTAFALAPDDDVEARVEARLGLAADAVGLNLVEEAVWQLEQALQVLSRLPGAGWRVQVRTDWVSAEVALLAGRPGMALKPSATSIALAERWDAPRHVAKSLLFRCVARMLTGSPEDALGDAVRAFDLAVGLGALPLVWPAAGLLTSPDQPLAGMLGAVRRGEVLEQGAYAVRGIGGSLPADLAEAWRSGADVRGLLERVGAV